MPDLRSPCSTTDLDLHFVHLDLVSNSSKHTQTHAHKPPPLLVIVSYLFIVFPFDSVLVVRNYLSIDEISRLKRVIFLCTCAVFSQQRVTFAVACPPLSL